VGGECGFGCGCDGRTVWVSWAGFDVQGREGREVVRR
jgi:hypothetical protein